MSATDELVKDEYANSPGFAESFESPCLCPHPPVLRLSLNPHLQCVGVSARSSVFSQLAPYYSGLAIVISGYRLSCSTNQKSISAGNPPRNINTLQVGIFKFSTNPQKVTHTRRHKATRQLDASLGLVLASFYKFLRDAPSPRGKGERLAKQQFG